MLTLQPASLTVGMNESAVFHAAASGTPPLAFSWYRNGVVIPFATSPDYTEPSDPILLNGASFKVRVSNARGIIESQPALVTVGKSSVTGSMATARYRHTATLLGSGKVLVAGGQSPQQFSETSSELYDPASGSFSPAGNMNEGRASHTADLLYIGKVLLVGGTLDDSGAGAELYDPIERTFTPTGRMVLHRRGHQATRLPDGKMLISGGTSLDGLPTERCEIYDPMTNTFSATASLSTPRTGHTASLLPDGKVLIVGGNPGSSPYCLASTEVFDPVSRVFHPSGSMATPRTRHVAVVLPYGYTLIKGGTSIGGQMATPVEIFTAGLGTFTPANRSFFSTVDGTGISLLNGLFHFAGGSGAFSGLDKVEIYDANRDLQTVLAPLKIGRREHTATLLPSGKILLAGGADINANPLSSAELYQ